MLRGHGAVLFNQAWLTPLFSLGVLGWLRDVRLQRVRRDVGERDCQRCPNPARCPQLSGARSERRGAACCSAACACPDRARG